MVVAAVAGLLTAPAETTADTTAETTIGAPGLYDPAYPLDGNGGYQVDHYDLRLTYTPATDELRGTTTILARTTQPLSQFNLDFLLHPSSVLVNNTAADFTAEPDGELVVRPRSPLDAETRLLIVVTYRDRPDNYTRHGKDMWRPNPTGLVIIGEPHMATWWFPSNDHPSDKATFDISLALPPDLEFISGGQYLSTQPLANGWNRWNWRSTVPHPTYAAAGAIGDYDVNHRPAPNGQQLVTAYHRDLPNRPAAEASFERTPELVDYLSTRLGPYPGEAQGGLAYPGRVGGLEVPARPFLPSGHFANGANTSVVVHELAHQWFGNSVSVRQWRDVWLNEGFAAYAEYLWSEDNGEPTAAELAQASYDLYPANHPTWAFPVAQPPPLGVPPAGSVVYHRGAMALQNLRVTVGDEVFFAILRGWPATMKNANASTEDFHAYAEHVAGRSLDAVFDTWVYAAARPPTGPNELVPTG
ncbi:hypothetical protein BU204_32285 [Actinophytocola xanthii]|uniref:Aminopeptidase N n=1 Tax=Actinophytocola xanthii TaxID=1912961 RepID=A0A1Q8C6G9_9PSEU|nr:hypothetical protein BU204_32285 [Actinophytocola xanthii]